MGNSETFGAIDSDSDKDWLTREFNDYHGANCIFEDRRGKMLEYHYDNSGYSSLYLYSKRIVEKL